MLNGEDKPVPDLNLSEEALNAAIFSQGNTRLHEAAKRGKRDEVRALLEAGASPRIRNARGFTPVDLIPVIDSNLEIYQFFVRYGVDLKDPTDVNKRLLANSILNKAWNLTLFFLNSGLDIELRSSANSTVSNFQLTIMMAQHSPLFPQLVKAFITRGACVKKLSPSSLTLLKQQNPAAHLYIRLAKSQTRIALFQSACMLSYAGKHAQPDTVYYLPLEILQALLSFQPDFKDIPFQEQQHIIARAAEKVDKIPPPKKPILVQYAQQATQKAATVVVEEDQPSVSCKPSVYKKT